MSKTSRIELTNVKNEDWYRVACELGHKKQSDKIFQYGEFANFEIEVDENLNIIGGKIIPHKATTF